MKRFELQNLPESLIATFLTFSCIPILSIQFWGHLPDTSLTGRIIFLTTYVALPLLLCISIYLRHRSFFVIFLLELILMTPSSGLAGVFDIPILGRFGSYLCVGLLLLTTVIIVRKDFLLCALNGKKSMWRKSSRIPVTSHVSILAGDNTYHATLEDASATGIAIVANNSEVHDYLTALKPNDIVRIRAKRRSFDDVLEMSLMWHHSHEGEVKRIGLRANDVKKMAALRVAIDNKIKNNRFQTILTTVWVNPTTRTFVLGIYILSLFGLTGFSLSKNVSMDIFEEAADVEEWEDL